MDKPHDWKVEDGRKARTKRTALSMPGSLWEKAKQRSIALDYPSVTDYIQALIRADIRIHPPHSGSYPEHQSKPMQLNETPHSPSKRGRKKKAA